MGAQFGSSRESYEDGQRGGDGVCRRGIWHETARTRKTCWFCSILNHLEPEFGWQKWLITNLADSEGFRMTERFRRWRVQGKMVSSYRWNQRFFTRFPHVWPLPKGHLPVFYGLDSLDGPFLDDLPMKNIGFFHGNQLLGRNLEDPVVRIHLDELDFLQLFLSDLQTAWIPWGVRPPLPATQGEFNGKIYPLVN